MEMQAVNLHSHHRHRTVTRIALAVGLTGLLCAAGLADDPIDTEYFQPVTIEQLDTASRSAMIVNQMAAGPGYQCGLRYGDQILAINGQRIYSRWEFDFHRNQIDPEHDFQMDLIVNRRGHLLPLRVRPLMPIRKLGFYEGERREYLDAYLRTLDIDIPTGVTASLQRIPARATYALQDWIAATESSGRDLRWLNEFVSLRLQLANQEWDKVEPPTQDIPVPYFRKLTGFYLSVAARHRNGEQIPDPSAHEVSLAYYVFHYPFPRFAPPLGDFDSSDKHFLKWVKQVHADTTQTDSPESPEQEIDLFESPTEIGNYLEQVKMAVVQPAYNGGWPYRYSGTDGGVLDDNVRKRYILKLEGMAAAQDKDETLYSFALAALYGLEADTEKLIDLIRRVRTISPYMAYRCVGCARFAWSFRHKNTTNGKLAALLAYLDEHPLQVTPKPSLFYDHIMSRSRHIANNVENFVGQTTQSGLIYHPISFASAFKHRDTLAEETEALNTAIDSPDFAQHREELLQRVMNLAIPYANPDDMQRLVRLGRDGLGRGQILDAFNRIVYADFMSDKGNAELAASLVTEVTRNVYWPQTDQYDRGYFHIRKQIAEFADDIAPEAAREQLLAIYADHGDLPGTLLLATALDKHGFSDDASDMRNKIDRVAYAVLTRNHSFGGQLAHLNIEVASLCAEEGQDLKMKRGLYYGARTYLDYADIPHEAPAYLLSTRYELKRGKLKKAVRFLADSLTADKSARIRPLYFLDGTISDSHDECREWLFRRIVAHENFDESIREQLAASKLPEAMPQVAQELGIDLSPAATPAGQ